MAMDLPLRLSNTPSLTQVFTPVNVAILTSLGIHGFILGLALPHWQWQEPSGENLEDRSTVGVIELTPAEQSRLPETDIFSSSALFPTPPSGIEDATVPAAPNLPAPPDSNYDYSLPPGQTIPPPPAMPNLPAYPNLPPLTSYGNLSRLPITNPPIPSLPQLSSSRPIIPRPPGALPPPPRQWENPMTPGLNRPNFGTLPPSQGTGFITRAPQNFNSAPEPDLDSEGEDTSPEKLRENTLVSIAQQGIAIKAKDSIAGTYPPIACRNRTEARVVYNVFPGGQKDLVGRSRYPIFNQLAQQAIAGRSYGEPTQVSVNFKYDPNICGGMEQFTPPSNQGSGEAAIPPSIPAPISPPQSFPAPQSPQAPKPTPVPRAVPSPGMTPAPENLEPEPTESPDNQTPQPTPEVEPALVPDAPAPQVRPPATVDPKPESVNPAPPPAPRATTPPAVPATPPPSAPPQRALPKTKGDLLREQNQAPSIVPPKPNLQEPEETETQGNVPARENALPAPMQSKK